MKGLIWGKAVKISLFARDDMFVRVEFVCGGEGLMAVRGIFVSRGLSEMKKGA